MLKDTRYLFIIISSHRFRKSVAMATEGFLLLLSLSHPDTRLFDSKWVKIETGRGFTTLTLPNLYKDDEGLYKLRMVTKGGTAEHCAFVSVAGELCCVCGRQHWTSAHL